MPPSIQITEASPLLHDTNCVYCHSDLELNDLVIVCDKCNAPHHIDCWKANGNRCGTFGCGGSYATLPQNAAPPDIIISAESESDLPATESEPVVQRTTQNIKSAALIYVLAALMLASGFFLAREEFPTAKFRGHNGEINSVSWSPDGNQFVSGSDDRTIIIWDVENLNPKLMLSGHAGDVNSVSWSPDGSKIASGGSDELVKVWDVITGAELKRFEKHRQNVNSVSWSPDSSRIASGSWDRTIRIWHVNRDEEVAVLTGHTHTIWDVSWSPDGSKIASASEDETVRIWDAENGELIRVLHGHTNIVWSISWSPDSRSVASGSQDGTVRIWVMDNDENSVEAAYTSYRNQLIKNVQWSPDGSQIAVANSNLVFDELNDWSSRQLVDGEFLFRKGGKWSPDGNRIAVGNRVASEHLIELWDISPD